MPSGSGGSERLISRPPQLNEIGPLIEHRGIGKKTAQKIVEIDRTGGYRRLAFATPEDKIRKLFTGIYGVGAKTADKWYLMGLRTLDDVRNGKGGVQINEGQRLGLLYYDDLQDRMPRVEAQAIFEYLKAAGQPSPAVWTDSELTSGRTVQAKRLIRSSSSSSWDPFVEALRPVETSMVSCKPA